MKLEVGVQGTKHSNRFLRALWAALRREFGKCAWQFSPRRFGPARTIRFGFADLGLKGGTTLEIGCSYTQRGDVDAVYFVWPLRTSEIDPTCDLGQRLKIATAKALEALDSPQHFDLAVKVNILTPANVSLYPYHDAAFTIASSSDHEFVIFLQIDGYDEYDAKQECFSQINGMVDFLAVATNGSFHLLTAPYVYAPSEHRQQLPDTVYWLDHDWMDDFPLKNDHLCLREVDKTFLNRIALADLNNKSETFLKTAHLFHMARKYDDVGISFLKTFAESCMEIATVLYVSAGVVLPRL